MKKIITLLFLFQNLLFGCAACQLMTPTAHLSMKIDIDKKVVKNIHTKWRFSEIFSNEMIMQYDDNGNKALDVAELKAVRQAMLDYLIPKDILTKITYANNYSDTIKTIKPNYKNFKITMPDKFLIFTYDAVVNVPIEDKSSLSFAFVDDESFFNFRVVDLNISHSELYHNQNLYLFTASIFFSDTPIKDKSVITKQGTKKQVEVNESIIVAESNDTKQNEANKSIVIPKSTTTKQEQIKKPEEKTSFQLNILKESILKVKSLFESIKDEKNPLSYLLLLFFAYIYGVIHALGPGHGKTLVASYFLSNERSYSKALYISVSIGFVHTFSAFILTLIIYFMVNTFLAQFINDTVFYTTKISAFIIISIALYLIYTKYRAYKKIEEMKKTPQFSFSASPHAPTCACNSCKVDKNSTDLGLIVSAGIIPCPGTTTIFIFAISLGLFYAGFLSALVMSMGMSTIIFFSALLSVAVRKKTEKSNNNLKKYLEYGSLIIILILGIILLLSA